MSVYYYLVCGDCKQYCDGVSRSAGAVGHLADSEKTLPGFIFAHRMCKLSVKHEVEEEDFHQLGYLKFTKHNYKKLVQHARSGFDNEKELQERVK